MSASTMPSLSHAMVTISELNKTLTSWLSIKNVNLEYANSGFKKMIPNYVTSNDTKN